MKEKDVLRTKIPKVKTIHCRVTDADGVEIFCGTEHKWKQIREVMSRKGRPLNVEYFAGDE